MGKKDRGTPYQRKRMERLNTTFRTVSDEQLRAEFSALPQNIKDHITPSAYVRAGGDIETAFAYTNG